MHDLEVVSWHASNSLTGSELLIGKVTSAGPRLSVHVLPRSDANTQTVADA